MKGWNENYARGVGKWQNFGPAGSRNPLGPKAPPKKIWWFARGLLSVGSNHRMATSRPSPAAALPEAFRQYATDGFFDEMMAPDGTVRPHYRHFLKHFGAVSPADFEAKRRAVDLAFLRQGVTFNVYGDSQGAERIFPFDLIPRVIPANEWKRLDAGLIEPNAQDVALREFIERVSTGFRAEAEHRGLSFRSCSIDAVVHIDQALLETLVRNLLSNALKFTRRGGVMLVSRRVGNRLSIEVFDSGLGIDPGAGDSVFQEFQRTKFAAVGANDGLGLGLSIVKRYAELLGIDVSYRSRAGHGTRFRVLLPAAAEVPAARIVIAPAAAACSLKQRRILVLDDEPLIVESLSRDLTDRGNTVIRAGTTSEAEAAIRDMAPGSRPEVAVVDFNLARGETGLDFIDRMERATGTTLPTLVLTGATDAATLSALMQCGRRWLTKPADPDAIATALAELAGPRVEQQAAGAATAALAAE